MVIAHLVLAAWADPALGAAVAAADHASAPAVPGPGAASAIALEVVGAASATSRVALNDGAPAAAASVRSRPAERVPVVAGGDPSAGAMAAVAAAGAGQAPTASIAGDAESKGGPSRPLFH